jgi:hypothetical protein
MLSSFQPPQRVWFLHLTFHGYYLYPSAFKPPASAAAKVYIGYLLYQNTPISMVFMFH